MNQPQIHLAVCHDECGAQRFASCLSDEIFLDANVCEIGIRPCFAQEHVRVAQRGSMNIELYMWHLLPNDLEQPRGFTLWQASFGIADFNQTHCGDFDILKRLPNPTGNGIEFPLGIFPARLRSVQASV